MKNSCVNKNNEKELVEIFKNLIRINTTNPPGNEKVAVEFIKKILDREGIQNKCIYSEKDRGNIIAWIESKGKNETPIILLSHIDVVKADGNWKYPSFEAIEEDGTIYGRGALDTKHLTAMEIMTLILLKRNNISLNRDVILIASADEENGSKYGMEFIKTNYPEYIKDAYVISEGGGFIVENMDNMYRIYTAGEKGACKVKLKAIGSSGHASCPPNDQALIKMSNAIEKICDYNFQQELCNVSKQFLNILKDGIEDKTLNDLWEYMTHNSITVNSFNIGDTFNVIPGVAEAEIEIRFIPTYSKKDIERLLNKILYNTGVEWTIIDFLDGYESSVNSELINKMEEKTLKYGEDAQLIPIIALGRTDGRFMKGDIYGFSPILSDIPFSEVLKKVHNVDECISVKSLIFGLKVIYETILEMK